MLKPVDPTVVLPQAAPQAPPQPIETIRHVFKVLHGCYGNLVFSKFATGEIDRDTGDDKGLVNAYRVWAHGLREFDASTIKSALARCMERHPEFSPSLAQFIALCHACKPRNPWKPPAGPALTMSPELSAQYREEHLARAQEIAKQIRESQPPTGGLDLLKQAIADAVGAAGGDEAAELLRLDRMLAPKVEA